MKRTLLQLGLIFLTGLAAYSNTAHVPFVFDDLVTHVGITENSVIKDVGNFIYSTKGYTYNPRRFIGYLTFALNYRLGGLDVTGYHVVNLAIHIINAMLVYLLVILIFRTPYFAAKGTEQRAEGKGQKTGDQADKLSSWQAGKQKNEEADKPTSWQADKQNYEAICSRFTIHDSRLIALFSALFFVSHPVQTQAVTYIVQRFASLAAMWYLASVVFYVKGRLKSQSAESKAQRGKKAMRYALGPMLYYSLSLVFAVLAMRTKETAFTLPLAIAAFEFIFFKTSRMKKILVPAVITVLVIISLGPAGLNKPFGEIWSDLDRNTRVQTDMPRWDYLMTELRVIVTYIRLIFFPVNQKLDYNYPVYNSLFDPPVLLSFLFLSTLFGTAVYLLYKTRRAKNSPPQPPLAKGGIEGGVCTMPYALCPLRLTAFGILWFFITLSVESSVIPIADVIFEHRVYLPSIGAFIAITASLFVAADKLKAGRPRAVAAFFLAQSLVVVGLSGLTYARNSVWQDDIRLIADAVSKNPGKASLYNGLGHAYLVKGFTDEAMGQFRIAMRLDPDYAQPHLNLGVAYGKKGMLDEAIGEFEAAMKLTPRNPEIYNNIAIIYRQRGQTAREITYLKISLEIDPYFAVSHYNIAAAYASLGWPDKAGEHFKIAHELDPDKY